MISNKIMLEAAENFGTPLFLYDIDKIKECYNSLFKFIPYKKLKIHYALKANYNIAILKALRDIGCGLDTVSPGHHCSCNGSTHSGNCNSGSTATSLFEAFFQQATRQAMYICAQFFELAF